MDETTKASLQDIAANYQKRLGELRQMQRDIRGVTATARTRDGSVSVEVGAQGQVLDIRFDPKVYDRMNPQRLSRTLMKLIGEAAGEATGKAREITAEFLPEDMAARFRDGEEDFTKFLPNAPSMLETEQE